MTMNIEEIVEKMDRLVQLGQNEYTGAEMAEELQELVELIRPKEVKFVQNPCTVQASHQEHIWVLGIRKYYCPGVELD